MTCHDLIHCGQTIASAAEVVVLAVPEDGMRMMLDEILRRLDDVNGVDTRAAAAHLVQVFCNRTQYDYAEYKPNIIKLLLRMMGDTSEDVITAANGALNAFVKRLEMDDKKVLPPVIDC